MKITVTDLLPGGQYALQFRSKNKTETSPWSRTFVVQVGHDLMPPAMPKNLAVEVKGDAFISTWDKVTTNDDGSDLTDFSHYIVRIRDVSNGFTVDLQSNDNRYELTFNLNLALFFPVAATIGVQVAAVDLNENVSEFTDEIIVQNPPPNPIRNLRVEPALESLVINFDKPLDLEDDFLEYRVFITNSATTQIDNMTEAVWAGQGTSYTYHTMSMVPLYTHVVAVDKFNSISEVVTSDAVTPKNSFEVDTEAPSIPTNLAGSIDGYDLNVTWTKPVETDLLGYQVGFKRSDSTEWSYVTTLHDVEKTTITPIEQFVDYDVRIRAHDTSFNYSGWSSTVTVEGATNVPPAVPTGLTVKGAITSAMVFWDKNTEPDMKEYEVQFRTSSPSDDVVDVTTSATTVSFSENVNANTTYYARVRAVDTAGLKSPWSAVAQGTVGFINVDDLPLPDLSDGNPPASSPVAVVSSMIDGLWVTWNPVSNNDKVTYEIYMGTVPGFQTVAANKVGETDSTFISLSRRPDGSDLVKNQNYYVKIIAKDVDGAAPPGAVSNASQIFTVNDGIDFDAIDASLVEVYRDSTRPASPKKNSFWYPPNGVAEFYNGTSWSVLDMRPTVIANGFINTAHIADAAITTAKIGNAQIVAANIKDAEISTAKIANAAITTAKIDDLAVNDAKIVSLHGGKIMADTIYARSIAVGMGNLWPDPYYRDITAWENPGAGIVVNSSNNPPGGNALMFQFGGAAGQHTYYVNAAYRGLNFQPGAQYRLRWSGRRGGSAPHSTTISFLVRYDSTDGTAKLQRYTFDSQTAFNFDNYYEHTITMPSDMVGGCTVGWQRLGATWETSAFQIADTSLTRVVGTTLIEDGAITTEKLLVGDGKNHVPNGTGEWGKAGGWLNIGTYKTDNKPDGVYGYVETVAGQAMVGTARTDGWWAAEPGEEFVVETWLKADTPGSMFYLELRDQDSQHATTSVHLPSAGANGVNGGVSYPVGGTTVPTTWTKYGAVATARPGVSRMQVGGIYFNHQGGTNQNAKISVAVRVRRRSGSVTIANGAINADHVQTKTLGADLIKTREIAADSAFIDELRVTSANITDLEADKITAGNGIMTNLEVKSGLTIGSATTGGWIRSYGYDANNGIQIDKNNGIIVNSGSISAKALNINYGSNLLPGVYTDFEGTPASYPGGVNGGGSVTLNSSEGRFGQQCLNYYSTGGNSYYFFGQSSTDYHTAIEPGETYILSVYVKHVSGGPPRMSLRVRYQDASYSPKQPYQYPGTSTTAWKRLSFEFTAPNDATAAIPLLYSDSVADCMIRVDGLQLERKTGNTSEPSPWSPGGGTRIDGGMIRTGEIRSNQNVTVNGKSQPMWSINMAGNMQIGNALVRGSLVVGSDIGGTDGIHSTIQSFDYAPGSAGWIIRSGGNSEFNDVKIRGALGIVDIDAGGRVRAGTSTHYTQMNATSFSVYNSSRVAFFAGTSSIYMNKPGTTERVFTINSSGGTFDGELRAFSGTNTGVRVTPSGQVGTNGVRGIIEFLDGGTSLGRIGAFSNGTLAMISSGNARVDVTGSTAGMSGSAAEIEAPNIRIEGLSTGKIELLSNYQPAGNGRGDITLKAGGAFTYNSVPGGDVTIQAGVRAVSTDPLHYFDTSSHIYLDANEVEVRGGDLRIGANDTSTAASILRFRRNAVMESPNASTNLDIKSRGSIYLHNSVSGSGNTWGTSPNFLYIGGNQTFQVSGLGDRTTTAAVNAVINSSGHFFRSTSIRAAKIDITTLDDWTGIKQLRPVTYYDRSNVEEYAAALDTAHKENTEPDLDNIEQIVKHVGLIAEEVEEVDPLLAMYNQDGSLAGVAYERVGVALIPWLHELEDSNEELRKENADLRGMIEDLAAQVASLTQP